MEENVIQINVGISNNIDVSQCEKWHVCEKDYIWNPATCSYGNGKYLASIMDNSAIPRDEITESYEEGTKTVSTNFNEKKTFCKTQNLYICIFINYYSIIDSC